MPSFHPSFKLRSTVTSRPRQRRNRNGQRGEDGGDQWFGTVLPPPAYWRPMAALAKAFISSSVSWIILPDTSAVTLRIRPVNSNGGP